MTCLICTQSAEYTHNDCNYCYAHYLALTHKNITTKEEHQRDKEAATAPYQDPNTLDWINPLTKEVKDA